MDKRQVRVFKREMMALYRVTSGIAKARKKRVAGLQAYIAVFKKILSKANSKYRDVLFTLSDAGLLSIAIKAKNVKEVFEEAMKVDGVTGLGVARFDSASVEQNEGFSALVEQIKDAAYISYKRGQNGSSTVLLQKSSKRGQVTIEFEPDEENHPGIVLLAEYALRSVKGDAPLLEHLQSIGFIDDPDTYGAREWKKGFDPRIDDI
jgi:hypothetical protein